MFPFIRELTNEAGGPNDNHARSEVVFGESEIMRRVYGNKVFVLEHLKPDQIYQAWVVAFLSNGKTLKSNVVDIHTLAGSLPTPERSEVGELTFD